nr:MAG TPA: hypothetical protein [Caudoviricetes sp.]
MHFFMLSLRSHLGTFHPYAVATRALGIQSN